MSYLSPLIDREIFFGNPQISGAQLSPDGKYITCIKPLEGVRNVWIKGIDDAFEHAIPLTNDKNRPISSYFWSRDSKYVLYVQDKGGDENYRVYRINPKDAKKDFIPEAKDLTPYEDIRAMIVSLPKKYPDRIFIGLNDRDKAWHDYYDINIETGDKSLILKNTEKFSGVSFDLEAELKLASRSLPDGGNEILKKTATGFEKILENNLEETLSPIKFRKDGKLYLISNVGDPDLTGLYLYDLENDSSEFLENDPQNDVDLSNISFSQITDELIATIYIGNKKRIYWKDKSYEVDYDYLRSQFPNFEISISSASKDEKLWITNVSSDTNPGMAFLFNRENKLLEFLYSPRPELPNEGLVNMTPVKYASKDGMEIPAYLSMPNSKAQTNNPAIIFVHGGPWARDHWGYNSYAQFLANRGYVVLQPNFRGSTGYGKKFLNAAINEWGQKMQDDLSMGAQFLIDKGYANPKKIAIMGGSYGGYATLAGLTFTPDIYAAGVSIVGPSNLFTLLETIPPYWESARVMFHKRMGNPNTKEGKAQLKRQSPFFHAENIKAPLLVAQGANDPRVKKSESDQIVIAMRELKLPVQYLNFPDEGHGFANPKNNMAFIAVLEKFLSTHLGGRFQEEVPESLQSIISKVDVDIMALEMPTLLSQDEMSKSHVAIGHEIKSTKFNYKLSLDMNGQVMNFEVDRTVDVQGSTASISDNAESPNGSMNDISEVEIATWSPRNRKIEQGPLVIEYDVQGLKVNGYVEMNSNKSDLIMKSENEFIMDGPSLDLYLTHLPLDDSFSSIVRVFDSQGQKFQTFSFKVNSIETVDLHSCYKCELKSVDGADKNQELWISKGLNPILVLKEWAIAEMGGAKMRMTLNQILDHPGPPIA